MRAIPSHREVSAYSWVPLCRASLGRISRNGEPRPGNDPGRMTHYSVRTSEEGNRRESIGSKHIPSPLRGEACRALAVQ